jgi:ferric-dicitrate binding protein FerR (iron transport regulator)
MSDIALQDEATAYVRIKAVEMCQELAAENESLRYRAERAEARLERIGRRRRNKALSTIAVSCGLVMVALLIGAVWNA